MNKWIPCKRRDFIRKLRGLKFDGPFSGAKHQFIVYKKYRPTIPSNDKYSIPQLRMMVREVERIIECEIIVEEWNRL